MDKQHYDEMQTNIELLIHENKLINKNIYLFGHCNATEELADLLLSKNYNPIAILDNNIAKHNNTYRNIPIVPPETIISDKCGQSIVCIVSRAYAAMVSQLRNLGFKGMICKVVDYNSYAEYSLSEETIFKMQKRVKRGIICLNNLERKYEGYFKIFCPFAALGDICFTMSYLPYFMRERDIKKCVICVIGNACAEVVRLYGDYKVEVFEQTNIDEIIQAVLYTENKTSFIAHQDRPYVINLHKALYVKLIPLEKIYCCGVFGLPEHIEPVRPIVFSIYPELNRIPKGKAVILSPYAKSVTVLQTDLWQNIVSYYKQKGYKCFTNVVGEEKALKETEPISPKISEIRSVVERAGVFIGIRSGLCDVIRYADCEKTALYPNYNYSDTKWKAIDMYSLDGWINIEAGKDFKWKI